MVTATSLFFICHRYYRIPTTADNDDSDDDDEAKVKTTTP
jgi:hypothetical protein